MSISTYKRWMKESFLYEADDDKYQSVGYGRYKLKKDIGPDG